MGLISLVKELLMAFFFVCSVQFWRMGLFWSFSILFSYYQLFKASLSQWLVFKPVILEKCPFLSQKLVSYPRCSPFTSNFRPVCIVTVVSPSFIFIYSFRVFFFFVLVSNKLFDFGNFSNWLWDFVFCVGVGNVWPGISCCL